MNGKQNKHINTFQKTKLNDTETISAHLEGWIGEMMGKGDKKQYRGQLILTSKRICFFSKSIFGEVFETIPIGDITSVETLSRLGNRQIRCHTSHDALSFKTFENKVLFEKLYDALEELRNNAPGGALASPSPTSVAEEIQKLIVMRNDGFLSDEEFETLKKKLVATP